MMSYLRILPAGESCVFIKRKAGILFCVSGFTLLEVLIALGIFATCAVTFLSASGGQLIMLGDQEKQLQAITLASNRMASLEQEIEEDIANNKFPAEVEMNGKFDEPFDDYKWNYKISKVELPVINVGDNQSGFVQRFIKNILEDMSKKVRLVVLTVYWGDDEDEDSRQEMTLTTHIANLK